MKSMGDVIFDHATDLWGVALVTLGVLTGVAFLVDSSAPASRVARVAVGDLLGWGRFLVPPVLVTVGVLLLLDRRGEEEDRWASPEPARVIIGAFLTLLAVAGLASLAGGSPHLTASTERISSAGGWLGAAVGNPLREGLGGFGSAVVLVALLVVAMVLFTGVSIRSAARGLVRATQWTVAVVGGSMTDDSSGDDDDDDPTDPFGRRVGPFDPEPSTATLPLVDEEDDYEDERPEEPEPEPEPDGGPGHRGRCRPPGRTRGRRSR